MNDAAWQAQLRERLISLTEAIDLDVEQQARFELLVDEALEQGDEGLFDEDPAQFDATVIEYLRSAIVEIPELHESLLGRLPLLGDDEPITSSDLLEAAADPLWEDDIGAVQPLDLDEEY